MQSIPKPNYRRRTDSPSPYVPSIALVSPCTDDVSCRICWGPEDDWEGGTLIAPCSCRGSSRFVHERCLYQWMSSVAQNKGINRARKCNVCQRRYSLPTGWSALRRPLHIAALETTQDITHMALQSPVGPLLNMYSLITWIGFGAGALIGAGSELAQVKNRMRHFSRTLELAPEFTLLGKFALAAAAEMVGGGKPDIYIDIFFGWLLGSIAVVSSKTVSMGVAACQLPTLLTWFVDNVICRLAFSVGIVLHGFSLSIFSIFGGGIWGCVDSGKLFLFSIPKATLLWTKESAVRVLHGAVCVLLKKKKNNLKIETI